MANTISNCDDIIDSRDVIARIEELEAERSDLVDEVDEAQTAVDELDKVGGDETPEEKALVEAKAALEAWDADADQGGDLKILKALADEASGYAPDWRHGATLISADHFEDYARELAEEIGSIQRDMAWPCNHIDWKAAAEELKVDYTTVDFDGTEYLIR